MVVVDQVVCRVYFARLSWSLEKSSVEEDESFKCRVASGGGASMDLTECGTRTNGLMLIAFNRGAFLSVRFRPCIKGQSMSWSGRRARLVVVVAVGW